MTPSLLSVCGGSTGSAVTGEAQRVVRGRGPAQSHGMDRQGTWEVLPLPVGKEGWRGSASMKSRPRSVAGACAAAGAPSDGHEPRQATARGAGWRKQ